MDCLKCYYISLMICLYLAYHTEAAIPEYFLDEHCSQTLALNHGSVEAVKLRLTKASKYPDGMRCAMRIQAPEGKRLVVRIEALDIYGSQDVLCQGGDYMQFFDGPTESSIIHPELPATVCQRPSVKHISTSGRFLVMRFISNTDLMSGSGVKLTITAFKEAPCSEDEFRCKSTSHCIKRSLRCDNLPSCPDDTDEAMPDCLSTAAVAGISVGCIVFVAAIVISIIVCCIVRERKKRARIIKRALEHKVSQVYATSLWGSSQDSDHDELKSSALWGPSQNTDDDDWGSSQHTPLEKQHSNMIWQSDQNSVLSASTFGSGKLDLSKIDPIWDGTLNYTEMDWDKHLQTSSVDNVPEACKDVSDGVNEEKRFSGEYDNCPDVARLFQSKKMDLAMTTSDDRQMKKVPSGFWEIDLSELGFDTSGSSPASPTVL